MISKDIFCCLNLLTKLIILSLCTALVPPEARLSVDSSAQLPAKREGEEKLFSKTISYPTTLPSPQKETAELCPGCNCLMEDTTDYRLVLTRRSSSRFAKIATNSQTNKLPIPRVPPSQKFFLMLCLVF